jgi:50S ribosomal subunit-associated GTPase HflX
MTMAVVNDQRLERIEEKLDKLSDTVSDLARIEERMLSVFKRLDRHEKRLDDQEDDLRTLSNNVILNSKTTTSIERLFWVIITATASVVVYMFR